jgi:hypothetical protein
LKGKFIGIIMTQFLSYIHSNIILPKYNKLNKCEKKSINIFISANQYKRPMIIYTKSKNPLYVNISIKTCDNDDCDFKVEFELIEKLDNSLIYTHEIKKNNQYKIIKKLDNSIVYVREKSYSNIDYENQYDDFVLSNNKIIVISIDFRNSTQLLVESGVIKAIEVYKKFHNDVVSLIKTNYYPYIYIFMKLLVIVLSLYLILIGL